MKHINSTFTDEEHLKIVKTKEYLNLNWHDFIIKLTDDAINAIEDPVAKKLIMG